MPSPTTLRDPPFCSEKNLLQSMRFDGWMWTNCSSNETSEIGERNRNSSTKRKRKRKKIESRRRLSLICSLSEGEKAEFRFPSETRRLVSANRCAVLVATRVIESLAARSVVSTLSCKRLVSTRDHRSHPRESSIDFRFPPPHSSLLSRRRSSTVFQFYSMLRLEKGKKERRRRKRRERRRKDGKEGEEAKGGKCSFDDPFIGDDKWIEERWELIGSL